MIQPMTPPMAQPLPETIGRPVRPVPSEPTRIGIVGLGNISGAYLRALPSLANLELTAVADLDTARAEAVVVDRPGTRACTPDELYAADDVDIVLNLTIPAAHAEVDLAAVAAGKHAYGEKPLALSTADAREVLDAAAAAGVHIGCAPDTVLGTGVQTARAVVDDGEIGAPLAATAFMTTPGHERWHPDPEFYYRPGGGPLLDMGPYYLSALVTILGPVARVIGLTSRPQDVRQIHSGPRAGTDFAVEVPTHVTGVLEHESGALSTLVLSFDIWAAQLPRIEIYGRSGSVSVPDPNGFDGPVQMYSAGTGVWSDVAVRAGYGGASRGFGLSEMASAVRAGREPRASGALAFHVLDVMEQLLHAGATGTAADVTSTCGRPLPVRFGSSPAE